MRRFSAQALALGLFVALGSQGLGAQRLAAQTRSVCNADVGPALDATLPSLAGARTPLASFRGTIVLLNFWATWCVPCTVEIPDLIALARDYRRRGVEVVGVDVGEPVAVVRPYVERMKIGYPILLAGEHDALVERLGIEQRGLPTTVVLNRDGTVCRVRVGLTSRRTFEQILTLMLD
jgi:thiol-disulfide isomerase/thioredoxin